MSFSITVADHVLFEDDYIRAVDKPVDLMVEPDRNGYANLLQQVRKYLKALRMWEMKCMLNIFIGLTAR
jgi:23S rRNA-/tRNA-specific pseudouridylate synthase